MMTDNTPAQRLYALDNLRAIMMWLGIVLHVAAIHLVNDSPLPWRDERRSLWADLLCGLIHSFRMPVFFILAGYFVAMLLQKRGVRGMLDNRVRRLGLPFALFWPPVFMSCVMLAMLFMHRMARGTWGLDPALVQNAPAVPQGLSTMHMWFLWMLLWFCVLTAALHGLAVRMPPALTARTSAAASALFARLGAAWWGFAVLALPLALAGSFYKNGVLTDTGRFLPPLAEWVQHGLFFVFGCFLFSNQARLFALYMRQAWRYALAGLLCFVLAMIVMGMGQRPGTPAGWTFWSAWTYNGVAWLWSFALIGLALRYMPAPRRALGYLADSSYWVYLVHMPLTIGFGALLFGWPMPALAKMGLNILATTLVCLASYHLFVRYTIISQWLNGKRHARQSWFKERDARSLRA